MRLRTLLYFFAGFVVLTLSASCGNATGKVEGGDPKFDASLPPPPEIDASSTDSGCSSPTWTCVYQSYFGAPPPGPGCSGEAGNCHGAATDPGAQASLFTCGATKDDCFRGITAKDASLVDTGNPSGSGLFQILRHSQAGVQIGSMPKRPAAYFFSADALKRIQDWIAAGAQNN